VCRKDPISLQRILSQKKTFKSYQKNIKFYTSSKRSYKRLESKENTQMFEGKIFEYNKIKARINQQIVNKSQWPKQFIDIQ